MPYNILANQSVHCSCMSYKCMLFYDLFLDSFGHLGNYYYDDGYDNE